MRFLENLALLFIGLQLTGYVDWSWWVVLSPVTIPFMISLLIILGLKDKVERDT